MAVSRSGAQTRRSLYRPRPVIDGDELVAAFGRVAREERLRQGIGQDELRRRCGMHRNYVGAIENGRVRPTLPTLARLAEGLGVPLAELIARAETRAQAAETPPAGAQRRAPARRRKRA